MRTKTAVVLLVIVCLASALLLVTGTIAPIVGGGVFAIALVLFGVMSRGFTR